MREINKKIKEREWVGVKREDKFLSSFYIPSTILSNFRLILKLTHDTSAETNKRSLKKNKFLFENRRGTKNKKRAN